VRPQLYSESLWKLENAVGGLVATKRDLSDVKAAWAERYKEVEREMEHMRREMEAQEAIEQEKREMIQQVRHACEPRPI
jgi:hypothetical protein